MFSAKSYQYFLLLFQGVLLQPDHKDECLGEAGRDGGQERRGQDARVLTGTQYSSPSGSVSKHSRRSGAVMISVSVRIRSNGPNFSGPAFLKFSPRIQGPDFLDFEILAVQ